MPNLRTQTRLGEDIDRFLEEEDIEEMSLMAQAFIDEANRNERWEKDTEQALKEQAADQAAWARENNQPLLVWNFKDRVFLAERCGPVASGITWLLGKVFCWMWGR